MKLLIIHNNRIGDAIMISHALYSIKENYPDYEVDLIVDLGNLIRSYLPNVKIDVNLHKFIKDFFKNPFTCITKNNLHKKYDIIVTFKGGSPRSFRTALIKTLFNYKEFIHHNYCPGPLDHVTNTLLKCLKIYNSNGQNIQGKRLILPKSDLYYDLPYLSYQNQEYNLAICPDSSTFTRNWGAQNFYEIAKKLSEKYNIFLFSGPNQIDDCAYIEQNLVKDNIPCVNLQGKTSRDEFIAAMSKMDLAITNDSGPMHVAGLVDIPVISIMGPDSPKRIGPFMHDKFYPVHKNICPPCVQTDICKKIRRKKDKAFPCVSIIKIEEVMDVIYQNNFL